MEAETLTWIVQLVIGLLLAIVGFFVKQLVQDHRKHQEQIQAIISRVVILEESRKTGAEQYKDLKDAVEALGSDMRFVREKIVVLLDREVNAPVRG